MFRCDARVLAPADRAVALVSLAVLLSSATWFAGTAVAPSLAREWQLDASASALLTSPTQFGFIVGTLLFAALNLADRFASRTVFFASAVAGAAANAGFSLSWELSVAVVARFATGVTLAGIYPVGMKIVASWSDSGLGLRLGIMVGALGLGTGLPYLVRWLATEFDWQAVVWAASVSAIAGGLVVRFAIADGPRLRDRARFDLRAFGRIFRDAAFRWNAFGYFGHMWELYAVWTLQAWFLAAALPDEYDPFVLLIAFGVVAIGSLGCVGGGLLSRRFGERRVALAALIASATACLLSPLAFTLPPAVLITFMLIWGVVIVADSPQFSALAARYCPAEYTGTALTVQNGVGFALTVISIQLVAELGERIGWQWAFVLLAPGPILGAWSMIRLRGVAGP